jgi:hypothetical protein
MNKQQSGIVYESWLETYEAIVQDKKIEETSQSKVMIALFAYVLGDQERGDLLVSQVEPIWKAFFAGVRSLSIKNIQQRQSALTGGRPPNYRKNVIALMKRQFSKEYQSEKVYKTIENWFLYLSENKCPTNIKVLEQTIKEIANSGTSVERLIEVVKCSIKNKYLELDFDLMELDGGLELDE